MGKNTVSGTTSRGDLIEKKPANLEESARTRWIPTLKSLANNVGLGSRGVQN